MKKLLFSCLAIGLVFTSCNDANKTEADVKPADSLASQTTQASEEATTPMTKEEADKLWMDYMTPGQEHQMLKKDIGKWTTEMKYFSHPDSPAMVTSGITEIKMVMGDRFQESVFKQTSPSSPEMPAYEGKGVTGFDKIKKSYFTTWLDNAGTGIVYMEGKPEADGKSIVFKGKTVDAAQGKETDIREVCTFTDDKNQLMEIFITRGGKEMKMVEMKMVKQ